MAEVTREHRLAVFRCLMWEPQDDDERRWCGRDFSLLAQAIADAEQRGYERGLANRDERCLQSDMQRIRERLAAERAWDEGFTVGADNQVSVTRALDLGERMPPAPVNPYRLPKGPTK